jgi:hypothetical protein
MAMFNELRANAAVSPYMLNEDGGMAARYSCLPERHEIPVICDLQLVVEFYSR